ncbi:MAG TPA: GH116 family glycosyl hydrolase, partial [Planctomycetota bacterium]|nr:GH116 family glycosyl hydrolase [Planctomycetota bacterium]
GTATSREFTITLPYVCFRIGGGRDLEHTVLQLLVDGQVVRRATGQERERLELQHWDVREFNGKPARLRIVDSATGPWGHVNVDWIVFADAPQRELGFSRQHPQVGDVALVALGPGVQHGADSPWMEPEAQIDDVAALRTVVADATHGDDESYESEHVSRDQAKQPLGQPLLAALLHRVSLKPGTTTTRTFAITWHFPNRRQRDDEGVAPGGTLGRDGPRVGNRYATRFGSALDVAQYLQDNQERLRRDTFAFRDALYRDTTLPGWFVQRIGMPLSTLATGVLQWWENGRAWAWEGVGCCEGTCGHVWNYAQGMARLFPELERSVREHQDFSKEHGLKADGAIGFRGRPQNRWAGDAQGGYVLKAYREHLCSPDHAFLQRNWPAIQQALEFLIREDGKEPDGLLEGEQHNTYDIEFFGPNTMVGSLYLGALKAGSRMATLIGDAAFAARCERIAQLGSEHSMARLWNGEYFVQQVDLKAHPQWQYGDGCLSDQLLGQWFADQLGLGYLYPRAAVRTALQSIWKYNWAPDCGPQMHAHTPERFFVHDGEAGLFTCTWPKSQHLGKDSVRYRDEVWSGIEYQVAAHLLREGFVTEGLAIVRGIHERYDGSKHNPYNEVECGDHYARALASWSCLLAISGFEYDGPAGLLGFAPKLTPEDFRCFFSGSDGWGTFAQRRAAGQQQHSIRVRTGRVSVRSLHLEVPEGKRVTAAELVLHDQGEPSSEPVPFVQDGVRIELRPTRELVLVPGTQGDLRTDVTLRFAD